MLKRYVNPLRTGRAQFIGPFWSRPGNQQRFINNLTCNRNTFKRDRQNDPASSISARLKSFASNQCYRVRSNAIGSNATNTSTPCSSLSTSYRKQQKFLIRQWPLNIKFYSLMIHLIYKTFFQKKHLSIQRKKTNFTIQITPLIFTCSRSTTETLQKDVKYI